MLYLFVLLIFVSNYTETLAGQVAVPHVICPTAEHQHPLVSTERNHYAYITLHSPTDV